MAFYVCGDIHGQYEMFMRLLKTINFGDHDYMWINGDIIDRGPDSIKLLQYIMGNDHMIPILGNHELMMYDYLRRADRNWIRHGNGGDITLRQFNELSEFDQDAIKQYIRNMLLQAEIVMGKNKYLISHSFFVHDEQTSFWKDFSFDTAYWTVWNSPWRTYEYVPKYFYEEDNRIHIIGHVPVQNILPETQEGLIPYIDLDHSIVNIDLGAAYAGQDVNVALCCVNLNKFNESPDLDAFTIIKP